MLESMDTRFPLEYQKLTPEECESRGILGRLVGKIADWKNPTRNGRKYSKELWEHVFNDPIMIEKIENRLCFGEIQHPTDGRSEIDPEKIAVCLAEKPKFGNDGYLYGVFDIIATPCGKILKTLLDYGSKVAVSSRGEGDLETDFNGDESVIPDSYSCTGWDVVFIPGVKEARPSYVMESYNHKKSLAESLNDLIENAKDSDKKIMKEAIENLHLNENEDNKIDNFDPLDDDLPENNIVYNIDSKQQQNADYYREEDDDTDVDNSESDITIELQEMYQKNLELEEKIIELQEKLSVCYTKEAKLKQNVLIATRSLSESLKTQKDISLKDKEISNLKTKLETADRLITSKDSEISNLRESLKNKNSSNVKLQESYDSSKNTIEELNDKISYLNEGYESRVNLLNNKIDRLTKEIANSKSIYTENLKKSNSLIEKYKKIANKAVDKYISSQAIKLGVTENEIKNKLPESYSFNDIDSVCEDLQQYRLNISKLPFSTSSTKLNENLKIKAKSSKNEALKLNSIYDDDIDNDLLKLAGF